MTKKQKKTKDTPDNSHYIIEKNKKLSDSLIWELQTNYYQNQTINTWLNGKTPCYITSNSYIAYLYAKVCIAYIEDGLKQKTINKNHPLYIIEIATGHGKFSYHFLKHLNQLVEKSTAKKISIKYIITDIVKDNVTFCKNQVQLQPYIKNKQLDFGYYDITSDTSIKLIKSKETINKNTLKNPPILIANYILDSIKNDVFEIKKNSLHECLATIKAKEKPTDLTDPNLIEKITLTYESTPCSTTYYKDPKYNKILDHFLNTFKLTSFLFPTAGLKAIENINKMTNNHCFILSTDKGPVVKESMEYRIKPAFIKHGSFSMNVNYYALKKYAEQLNGTIFHSEYPYNSINTIGFAFQKHKKPLINTQKKLNHFFESIDADNFYSIKKAAKEGLSKLTLKELLALIKFSHYDTSIFLECYPYLIKLIPSTDLLNVKTLCLFLDRIWEQYYFLNDKNDIGWHIGWLFYQMKKYEKALYYFNQSRTLYGLCDKIAGNIAICYYRLKKINELEKITTKILKKNPKDKDALLFKSKLKKIHKKK